MTFIYADIIASMTDLWTKKGYIYFLITQFSVFTEIGLPRWTSSVDGNSQLASVVGSAVQGVDGVLGIPLVVVPGLNQHK